MNIRNTLRNAGLALLATATTTAALAHAGHGDHDSLGVLATLAHPLELRQLLTLVLLACVLGRLWTADRRSARSPLALALVAGAAAAATGLALLARA